MYKALLFVLFVLVMVNFWRGPGRLGGGGRGHQLPAGARGSVGQAVVVVVVVVLLLIIIVPAINSNSSSNNKDNDNNNDDNDDSNGGSVGQAVVLHSAHLVHPCDPPRGALPRPLRGVGWLLYIYDN